MSRNLILGHIWAAPVTLIGLLWALICGCRYIRQGYDGTAYFVAQEGGLGHWFLYRFKFGGYTLGAVIVARYDWYFGNERFLKHEHAHVRQCMVGGVFSLLAYPLASLVSRIKHGDWYWNNHFEVKAREAELRAEWP